MKLETGGLVGLGLCSLVQLGSNHDDFSQIFIRKGIIIVF